MFQSRKYTYLIPVSIISLSLVLHLTGCFYLYDFMNDEGGWLINSKNEVLFHKISLEGIYYTSLSPLNTFLHIFIFKIFEPNIFISRYISIFLALCTLMLFFCFARKFYHLKVIYLAMFIIVVNSIYTRITTFAILEPKVHFFEIITLFFCFSDKRWIRVLSFIPLSFSVGFKPNSIIFIIPVLYACLVRAKDYTVLTLTINSFKEIILDVVIVVLGLLVTSSIFFYISYIFDPQDFITWGLKTNFSEKFNILNILKDPFNKGIIPVVNYFFLRTPVTSLCFLWGIISAIKQKNKRYIDKFMLLWIFSGFCFYSIQVSVSERYLSDLIFPASLVFANAVFTESHFGNLYLKLKSCLLKLIIVFIFIFQIGSTLYFFLVLKADRPAIQASRWLKENAHYYKTIFAPAHIIIEVPVRSLVSSDHITVRELLAKEKIEYPILCVIQKEASIIHSDDENILKQKGKIITKIGYFWIYEILNK